MSTLSNTLFFLKDFSSMTFQISIKKGVSGIRLMKKKAIHHEHVKKYIEPNINDIEYLLKMVIVMVDCLEIFCASQVFGGIYDNLKWKIVDHYFCIWLGEVKKCDYGIHIAFIGVMVAMYSCTMSIFITFMELPPSMILKELNLSFFRLGLWYIGTKRLYYWYNKKITTKYAKYDTGLYPKDKESKMGLYDFMIGDATRRTMKMWRWTIKLIIINIILRCFEVYIETIKRNREERNEKENNLKK